MKFHTSKVWQLTLHIVLSGFLFTYTCGVFNTPAANISSTLNWGSSESNYTALFNFLLTLSALIGASIAGPLMNEIGRRKSLMFADLTIIFSSLLTCVPYTLTFAIGRCVSGFAAGIFLTVPPTYVNEITPDELLPKTGPMVQISTNVGFAVACGFGLILPTSEYLSNPMNNWWFFMFAFPGLVAFYQFCYFWLVCKWDSPIWLMERGRKEESLKSLRMIYTEEGVEEGLKRFAKTEGLEKGLLSEKKEDVTLKELFCGRKYRKMMRIGIVLAAVQQLSGINAAVFYSTSVFMKISDSVYEARLYTFMAAVLYLICSLASIPLLGRFGRVTLLLSGEIMLALDLCALGVMGSVKSTPNEFIIAGIMLIFVFFSYSLGGTLWMYLGEVCIDKALGVSATVNLMLVCVVAGVFPLVVEAFGIEYTFFFFGGCMALGVVYTALDLIETRGKSKSEIISEITTDS